MEVFVIEVEVK